jgi:hypothetical protein
MLPEYFQDNLVKPLNLEVLAQKWMDSSYEVREAAQSLLKCELKRVGPNGRLALIKLWEPHLNSLLKDCEDFTNTSHVSLSASPPTTSMLSSSNNQLHVSHVNTQGITFSNHSSTVNFMNTMHDQTSASGPTHHTTNDKVYNESTSRLKRKQYIAIIILSVIGAEFGQDVNTNKMQAPNRSIPKGFSIEDHTILKRISKRIF